jgi:hypothetical protein
MAFLTKFLSRSLLVWGVGTWLLTGKYITEQTWLILSLLYLGYNLAKLSPWFNKINPPAQ